MKLIKTLSSTIDLIYDGLWTLSYMSLMLLFLIYPIVGGIQILSLYSKVNELYIIGAVAIGFIVSRVVPKSALSHI